MEAHVLTSSLSISRAKVRIISYITKKIGKNLKKSPSLNQKLREGYCKAYAPINGSTSLLEAADVVIRYGQVAGGVAKASDSSRYTQESFADTVVECTVEGGNR